MNIIFPSLFSLVFIAIGAGFLRYTLKTADKAKQAFSWPTAEGEISHAAVLWKADATTNTGGTSTFKADISYRYKVNGKDYSSSQITFMDYSSSRTRAQSIVSRYPDKSKVNVYYDPMDPSDSVLEPGSDGGGFVLAYVFGGAFAAFGLFFLLMSLTGHVHMATHN